LWEIFACEDLTPALSDQDKSVRVFDTATWAELSRLLHTDVVSDIQISRDGHLLISYSESQVRISTVDPKALAKLAITRIGRQLSRSEKEST
jgi:WD40 repeat protein